jgi:hypothetical protein
MNMVYVRRHPSMQLLRTVMVVVEVVNVWRDLLIGLVRLLRQGCISFTDQSINRASMCDLKTLAVRSLVPFFFR